MSGNRVTCCNCASKVIDLQQVLKAWKEKSMVDQKCVKVMQHWVLHTFGYDVKIEMDEPRKTAKIQAIENKRIMKMASSELLEQDESSESEVKIMIMEVRMDSDYLESDDDNVLPEERVEPEMAPVTIASRNNLPAVPVEIGSGPTAEVVYIAGNYTEENNSIGETPSSSYFILRSNDNEEIPVQIDYSPFLNNGDSVIQGDNNVFYRLGSTSDVSTKSQSDMIISRNIQIPSLTPSSSTTLMFNPLPEPKKPKSYPKIQIQPQPPKPPKPFAIKRKRTPAVNKNKPDSTATPAKQKRSVSPNQSQQKNSNEFGLTLREKAEVYVSIKSREAVRKVPNGYECAICTPPAYTYSNVESCMTHTKIHFEGKPYKCDSCDDLFTVQRELLVHKRERHPRIKPIASKSSTAVSPSKTVKLKEENQKPVQKSGSYSSATGKKWRCQVAGCNWCYATSQELGWHLKAHSQSRV